MPVIEVDYEELKPWIDAEVRGFDVSTEEVLKLEERLQRNECDVIARLTMIRYFGLTAHQSAEAAQRYTEHLIWLIDQFPASAIHRYLFAPIRDKRLQLKLKKHWLHQVQLNPKVAAILDHAAHSCRHASHDDKTAELLWKRALRLLPQNEDFLRELSFVYQMRGHSGTLTKRKAATRKAIDYHFQAWKLHKRYPCNSYLDTYVVMITENLAEDALALSLIEEAIQLGRLLIRLKPKLVTNDLPGGRRQSIWHYQEAVYKGNAILGKAALLQGNYRGARLRLSEMSKSHIARHMDWKLAQQLLDRGECQTVIDYIKACQRSIRRERKQIATANITVVDMNGKSTVEETRKNLQAILKHAEDKLKEQIAAIRKGEPVVIGVRI